MNEIKLILSTQKLVMNIHSTVIYKSPIHDIFITNTSRLKITECQPVGESCCSAGDEITTERVKEGI